MASAGDDDIDTTEEVDSGVVRPFVAEPDEEVSADDDGMSDGAEDQKTDLPPLPLFPDAAVMPDYRLQHTAASSLKSNPDYLLHIRQNGEGLLAGVLIGIPFEVL